MAALNGRLVGEEEAVVNHGSEDAAQQRSDPIDSVISPVAGGQSWTKRSCRIDGGACEWAAEEDAYRDCETDSEGRCFVECASSVNGGGKHNEDEEKRHHTFEQHGVQACEVRRQKHDASSHRTPNSFRNDRNEYVGGCHCAKKLRDPVEKSLQSTETSGDPKAHGDGGVQMTAGNVSDGADHYCVREAVGDGGSKNADGGLSGGAQILIGANRSDAEKDQRECPDKLREKLLRQAIHKTSSRAHWQEFLVTFRLRAAGHSTGTAEASQKRDACRAPLNPGQIPKGREVDWQVTPEET
jgi:hypothetical protein